LKTLKNEKTDEKMQKCEIIEIGTGKETLFPSIYSAFKFCSCTSPRTIAFCNQRVWNNKIKNEILQQTFFSSFLQDEKTDLIFNILFPSLWKNRLLSEIASAK